MRFLMLCLTIMIFIRPVAAQEDYPSLVGPIVYAQSLRSGVLFQDIGSGEVWEIQTDFFGNLTWSPDGCYALFGERQNYALIDLSNRTIETLNLIQPTDGTVTLVGLPRWSPDSTRLAYGLFDGDDTTIVAYNVITSETYVLFVREDFDSNYGTEVLSWSSENVLTYIPPNIAAYQLFEVDLATQEIRYVIPDPFIYAPVNQPLGRSLRSPDNSAVAVYFDLSTARGMLDDRFSRNNRQEMEAIRETLEFRSGIEIYDVPTRETTRFELGGQIVSAARWSPDGSKLAILTFPGDDYETAHGAYIYDRETHTLTSVGDLHPVRHTDPGDYGYFQPDWSADGRWVTLYGLNVEWVIYNLEDETATPLAQQFQEPISIMRVPFTSVTQYDGQCD